MSVLRISLETDVELPSDSFKKIDIINKVRLAAESVVAHAEANAGLNFTLAAAEVRPRKIATIGDETDHLKGYPLYNADGIRVKVFRKEAGFLDAFVDSINSAASATAIDSLVRVNTVSLQKLNEDTSTRIHQLVSSAQIRFAPNAAS